jgi:outer membrane lipoprotein-sorting protein
MKNLNSLLAFALLVLVVAGCGSSSNNNSNSSNSSNSNSSNNGSSNNSANTSSTEDKDTKGVFHDDKAGIRLQAPEGWTTKLNGEQLTMSPPDDSMKIITWVPEGDFQEAIKDLEKKLSERIQRMKTNKDGSESSINGMPTYTIAGTGQIDGEDIEWSVDIIKAPKKPVIVLSFAKQGAWEKHQDDIKQLVASIKPTS